MSNLAAKKRMILLTGATGFLGPYILDVLLPAGEKVRVLVRDPRKVAPRPGLEVVEGDILDVLSLERAMEGVDKVVHAAAVVSFWKRRREELFRVNVEGTANVVNACLDAGVKLLVHVSSVAALGRPDIPVAPIDEHAKWVKSRYNSTYGRTKYVAEMEVQRGIQEGLKAVICNPAIIIGKGAWDQGTPKLFTTVAKGLRFYNPGKAGFVPAVDVARAIHILLHAGIEDGRRYLLVSDSLYYKDFFQMVADSLHVKAPSIVPPAFLVKLAARLNVMMANLRNVEPLITPETVTTSRGLFQYDGTRICKELGFQYSDIRSVIAETGEAYRKDHGH
jgi:nucleoside-diphosphate-sugar epimerase